MSAFQGDQWLGPGMVLPQMNAEPPGGRACGAIAGQLIQAAGKSVLRLQPMAAAFLADQPPPHETTPRSQEADSVWGHY